MEVFLSAVLAELTTRSINIFINKITKPTALDMEDRLCRILHQAQIIVDEVMGRRITNHAILQQLDMIRDSMHRGYYMLDVFRCQSLNYGDTKDQVMTHSLPKLNSWKGLCSSGRSTKIPEQMEKALDDLSSMIIDVKESLKFMTRYPRLYRQPYSMHLLLENCMFGRKRETEIVVNFLLQTQPHGAKELDVLPIVGPTKVGKTTLVAHVCKDERVRDHFSEIWFLHEFTDDEVAAFTVRCATKHQHCVLNLKKDGRLLIIVDLARDLHEEAWNKLYYASKQYLPSDSKIIVVSQSDKITKFGSVQALTMNNLSYEEYWYFFKTLAFGSTDPKVDLRLACLAMEIARIVKCNHLRANFFACLLRENIEFHFWCKVMIFVRGFIQKHVSRFGEHPFDVADQKKPSCFGIMATTSRDLVIYHQYHQCFSDELPKIRLQDVIYGDVRPDGKFDVLAWRSSIPPYHSYVFTCEIGELKTTGAKRKRSMKNSVTLY